MDAETRATNKANREMDALRHLHLQEANKTIIKKLDRIIKLLEEIVKRHRDDLSWARPPNQPSGYPND